MHNLKLMYFGPTGGFIQDEGYRGSNSALQVDDVIFSELSHKDAIARYNKVLAEGRAMIKKRKIKYLVVDDEKYIGLPMLINNEEIGTETTISVFKETRQ